MTTLRPDTHQADLPRQALIRPDAPGDEAIPMDVLFVGAGPAGLAGAIELARLAREDAAAGGTLGDLEIGVLEKASALGEHNLSGAIVNPRGIQALFPGKPIEDFPFRGRVEAESVYLMTPSRAIRIPTPPTMRNHGNYNASICELVRWLGNEAEGLGVNVFTGFPVDALLVDQQRVIGVRTTPSGLDRNGDPGPEYTEPTELTAKVTVLSEGTRGSLSQGWQAWQGVASANPQIFALGVKEVWKTTRPLDRVIHTMGWPLPRDAFGGSFVYPQGPDQVAIGLVVGLDYHASTLDVHERLQHLKLHPLLRPILEGATLVEWGAKTIPEGGYYALPARRSGDGCVVVGDAAGFVDVPSLKGIDYAIQSGIFAARAIFAGLTQDDTSARALAEYDRMVNESYILEDLHRTRNMRLAFKDGFIRGGLKAGLMTVSGGRFPGRRIAMEPDVAQEREVAPASGFVPDNTLTFSKVDAVFKSGNATRDTIPSHLIVGEHVSGDLADFYAHLCPAGVYERDGDALRVNPPNCVDCKATDVVGPRWTPREAGSGPKYRSM